MTTLAPARPTIEEARAATASPAGARPAMPGTVAVLLGSVTAFSVAAIFVGFFAFGLTRLQEQRSQYQLYGTFRSLLDPSSPIAPSIGGVINPGTPVALISSPAAGLSKVVVVEGTSSGELLAGPGHLPDSPLPGQIGQCVLVGKSTTAGAPFRSLWRLRRGDVITLTTGQGTFRYLVEDTRVAGDRLPQFTSSLSLLTLVTSARSGWLGLSPSHLLYVDATLESKPVAAPPGRPRIVARSELPGYTDPAAWPFVVMWVGALLAFALLFTWLRDRMGGWRTWIIGAPILFAVLWGLSMQILRLLPNVY